ncbi:MAG: DNA replication/repair protein RecF [Acidaminococcaceae bacterium]|jgi:DNA replication and repair protein RecF|nr:DNA replication/repair protein RecF [Acidaminococcaceae bacterium]
MKITNLRVENFRNYASLNLPLQNAVNIIYGNNAQGKTNFLEAIYYAAFGIPARTRNEDELVRFTADSFCSEVKFKNSYTENKITVKRWQQLNRWKKEIFLNDKKISAKEHYGLLNIVLFAPDDLQIVKGEPGLRRKFLDMEIAQTNKYYYELLVKYNKILAQRNKFLKNARDTEVTDEEQLKVWDEELSSVAAEIVVIRLKVLKSISQISAEIYSKITEEKEVFSVDYLLKTAQDSKIENNLQEKGEFKEFYLKEMEKRRVLDTLRGYTSIGPHRDDLLIKVDANNLRSFGSQGQQRSGALALKLAELEFIKENKEEYPVLLLDDVMSELDGNRRKQLLTFINGKVQTFLTVNDKELVKYLPDSKYFYVENGKISEE